ncbi:DUF6896 domain-containing protein [Streptomyces sp. AK02-04a]|uniref:DUF6896 domain-containing protein n=1 Tax=Streptomyces sp. AK02-04a TaxID=3028649 RepID=UPI0039F46E47
MPGVPVDLRRISRSGHIGSYFYKVHGAGCRFVSDNGTEVDVDFAADGSEVFDLWRLRGCGLSLPEPLDVTDQEMRSAVQSLQPLLNEVRPGWFGVANWSSQDEVRRRRRHMRPQASSSRPWWRSARRS